LSHLGESKWWDDYWKMGRICHRYEEAWFIWVLIDRLAALCLPSDNSEAKYSLVFSGSENVEEPW